MYSILKKKNLLCTGCGACVNICRENAISYKENIEEDGSLIAQINQEKCVDCGLCRSVCPQLNTSLNDNWKDPECYAVMADDDIRTKSSSGGAFTILSNYVLEQNGVVCGAAWGEEFEVHHIIVTKKSELPLLRRSKYVQSRIEYVYRELKKYLECGKKVLFVGCPCQVAGLKSYLKAKYQNLITVDLYCNYTPSPVVMRKYLEESYGKENIDSVEFRIKDEGWIADICDVKLKNRAKKRCREFNDSFQQGYHVRLYMRKVCEDCNFADIPRQGDFSIGDFWWIEQYHPELNDQKGTSCILVNNQEAKDIFEVIVSQFKVCERVELKCMENNRKPGVKAHRNRDYFYKLLQEGSFKDAVEKSKNGIYDIVLWGNWSEKNYGSELTYYALYQVLSGLNYNVLMVERPKTAVWGPNEGTPLFQTTPYPSYACHELYKSKDEMIELNEKSDIFLVGSDQIWHHDLYKPFGEVCYFDYVYNSKKKIAYAASFGREYWNGTEEDVQETTRDLQKFDFISVREKSGVEICKEKFNVTAEWVLDPVFVCDSKKYVELSQKSQANMPEKYIGVYMLDIENRKLNIIKNVKEKIRIPEYIITDAFKKHDDYWSEEINLHKEAFCEDWLKNIITSEFVITDSFHGMCFSIIFHKPFIAVINEERGGTRFRELTSKLGLSDRIVTADVEQEKIKAICDQEIDYKKVDSIIEMEKERSLNWLKRALLKEKKVKLDGYDILLKRLLKYQYEMKDIKPRLKQAEEALGGRKWDIQVHRNELNEQLEKINRLEKELIDLKSTLNGSILSKVIQAMKAKKKS